jgi:hypothetical protein
MSDEEVIENLDLLLAYDLLKEEKDLNLIRELKSIEDDEEKTKNFDEEIKGEDNES